MKWYRIEDHTTSAPVDEFGYPVGRGTVDVVMFEYGVLRETPKGVRLEDGSRLGKYVKRDATRRWACPTPEEAVESYLARKESQRRILNRRLEVNAEATALVRRLGTTIQRCDLSFPWGDAA